MKPKILSIVTLSFEWLVFSGFLVLLCLLLLPFPAHAAGWSKEFVQKAAMSNQFEIQESQVALDQSASDDVKKFAQQIIDDHTAAGDALKDATSKAGYDESLADGTLDDEHQKMVDSLKSLSGDAFDKQYIKDQADAHRDAVNMFGKFANSVKDRGAIQDFAKKTLTTLQEHQRMAQQLQAAYK